MNVFPQGRSRVWLCLACASGWAGGSFVTLGLAVEGCGTFSGDAKSHATLVSSPPLSGIAAARLAAAESTIPPPAEVVSNAAATDIRHDPPLASALTEAPTSPRPEFDPIAFEPLPLNPPVPYFLAFAGAELPPAPLVAQATTPTTQESTTSEALDSEPQEYDPWEPFNEKMFTFNY